MASMKLVFEKGPRNGEIRTYNPRSKVRIGRIVKGNNLNIKDNAISSQHLTIHFDSDSGKWVITDLDSSNGTHLNSSKLEPLSPFPLSNADEIKIGDSTSIRVEIVGEICKKPKVVMVDEECPDVVEGGSVRVHKDEAVKKGVDSEVNLGIEHPNRRGRGRAKVVMVDEECPDVVEGGSVRVHKDEAVKKGVDSEVNLGIEHPNRRGRGRAKVVMVDEECPDVVEGGSVRVHKDEAVKKGVDSEVNLGIEHPNRRGRGRAKKESDGVIPNVEKGANPKQEQIMVRRSTRNSKKATDELLCLEKVISVRRTTRSVKNVENKPENESLDVGDYSQVDNIVAIADSRKTRGGRGRKKKIELENSAQLEVTHVTEEPIGDTEKVVEQGEEAMGNTIKETPLGVSELRCQQPIMVDMAGENDSNAIASHFEQDTLERLQNDNTIQETPSGVSELCCEQPIMGDKVGENDNNAIASHSEQDIPERLENDNTIQVTPLGVSELRCQQPIMVDMAGENDSNAIASHFEQDTLERLQNDNTIQETPSGVSELCCEQPIMGDKVGENDNNAIASHSEQDIPERLENDNTIQETPLGVSELRCEQPIMVDIAGENDNNVIASHFEQDTPERLENDNRASASHFVQDSHERLQTDNRDVSKRVENDMVLEGGEVEKTVVEEIDEELDDAEIDKGEKEHEFETLPDLEKMTLGDWFDYLKLSLPKQIYGARDEIISDMRKRAEQVDEYMVQQQNEKGK